MLQSVRVICNRLSLLGIIGIVAANLTTSTDVAAQSATAPRNPVCLVRPSINESVAPSRVIAPKASQESLEKKGFVEFTCGRAGFTRQEQLRFQDFVCRIAVEETEGTQRQFEYIFGERPAILCAMAELALGEMPKKRGRN